MKYIKIIVLMLIILNFINPTDIFALTGNISIECSNEKININDEISCSIKGNKFNDAISSFHAKITSDTNLIINNFVIDQSWLGATNNGVIDLYTDKNKNGDIIFAKFNIQVMDAKENATATIKMTDIIVGDSKYKENNFKDISKKIEIVTKNNSDDKHYSNNDNKNKDNVGNSDEDYEETTSSNILNENKDKIPIFIVILGVIVALVIIRKNKK